MALSAAAPTQRYQEKREAILAAAARLFNEEGVRGATLSGIAASVGLVTNSVTYYYRKKEDLATACFLRSIEAHAALCAAAADLPTVAERLHDFFQRHAALLAGIESGAHAPLLVFNDIRALPEPQADTVFTAYTAMFRQLRDLLKGPETATLSRDELNARAHIVLSNAHWVRAWIGRHEVAQYPRVAARVSELLVKGMAGADSRWQTAAPGLLRLDEPAGEAGHGTSEAFLRAATQLVNEQGYRGASVDKISARLNLTKGSFYHHHDTKHDVIEACFERNFAIMRRALGSAEAAPGDGWTRTCAAAQTLVSYQLSPQGPLLRATATSALPDRQQREEVRRSMHRLTERLTSLLVDGLCDGSVRPIDPAIGAQTLIAAINAASELQRWVPGATPGNIASVYVRPSVEGVLCPGASPGPTATAGQTAQ